MKINFVRLQDGTKDEFEYLESLERSLDHDLSKCLISMLKGTDREAGYPVSTLKHSLQAATRALRDNAGDELVVAALFHDVADVVAPNNHAKVGAEMLRPFISERTYWVMAYHNLFQGFYYWHHVGRDQHARDRFKGHPHFEVCASFVEKWDQNSFDPNYDTLDFDTFLPIMGRVFSRAPFSQGSEK